MLRQDITRAAIDLEFIHSHAHRCIEDKGVASLVDLFDLVVTLGPQFVHDLMIAQAVTIWAVVLIVIRPEIQAKMDCWCERRSSLHFRHIREVETRNERAEREN